MKETFANRLQKAINLNNIKPIDLANKTKISISLISSYLSGRYKAKDTNLNKLAEFLGVNETWLLGYDVPIDENDNNEDTKLDELDLYWKKYKDILTDDDRETMKFIFKKRMRDIDSQNFEK